MTELLLNEAQSSALQDALSAHLSNMSVEIADTDLKSFRDNLKAQRDRLQEILTQLES